MKTAIYQYRNSEWIMHPQSDKLNETNVQLVLCFGDRTALANSTIYEVLRSKFTEAVITICSDEVDAVDEVFLYKTLLSGFYSYGEISPLIKGQGCQLHNQTMTITTFNEIE